MAVVNPNAGVNHSVQAKPFDLNIHPKLELEVVGKVSSIATKYLAKVTFNPSTIPGAPQFEATIPLQADSPFNAIKMLHGIGAHFKKAQDPAEFHAMVEKLKKGCVVMQTVTTNEGYNLEFHELNKSGKGYERFSTDTVKVTNDQHAQMKTLLEALEAKNIATLPQDTPSSMEAVLTKRTNPLMTATLTVTQEEEEEEVASELLLTQVKPVAADIAEKERKEKQEAADRARELEATVAMASHW